MQTATRTCFIIGPIGEEGSTIRQDADQLVTVVLSEILKSEGYQNPIRADSIAGPGHITKDIVSNLLDADIVIADLREVNANVYYELAVRNVMRKAVITFAKTGSQLPFDVKDARTIFIDISDVNSVHKARESLKNHLSKLPKAGTADSPLSVALDSIILEQGGAIDRAIARILKSTESIDDRLDLLVKEKEGVMYETAQSMWQAVVYGSLERIVMDLQHSDDKCSERCLGLVREIERDLMKFAQAPYLMKR